jgi:hypothetical protein
MDYMDTTSTAPVQFTSNMHMFSSVQTFVPAPTSTIVNAFNNILSNVSSLMEFNRGVLTMSSFDEIVSHIKQILIIDTKGLSPSQNTQRFYMRNVFMNYLKQMEYEASVDMKKSIEDDHPYFTDVALFAMRVAIFVINYHIYHYTNDIFYNFGDPHIILSDDICKKYKISIKPFANIHGIYIQLSRY